ncbi:hypothetical protein BJV82DRAFT_643293 [Fennellomyces sp. T-0311]|nr:hypothetical protein BJV82DRAFT_643293 [Fennellomyces sp. T-0311]
MEAIDEFRGENIARSLAYTVLEYRQQHKFSSLAEIGSNLLCQRLRFLGPNNSNEDPDEWNHVVQWQQDDCPQVIEKLWSGNDQDKLYQNPVYYKRLDAETLHCMVEFAYQHKTHYAVVMALEDGNGDISELKYQNTKSFGELEWQVIKRTWPDSLEQAEREFVSKIAHPPQVALSSPSPEVTPDGYWGDWSSDEEEDRPMQIKPRINGDRKPHSDREDSDDDYYARWSQNPGTLTPGIGEEPVEKPIVQNGVGARMLQPYTAFQDLDPQYKEIEKLEIQEEYDNSFNPLFTVPSVPDLMDAHQTALAELTQMLHDSLPGGQKKAPGPSKKIDPMPKIVRSRQGSSHHVPGAFPDRDTTGARTTTSNKRESYGHEAGRMLLEKSLRALVNVSKMLGFKTDELLDIAERVIKEESS